MTDRTAAARHALDAIRRSQGFDRLTMEERAALEGDLARVEQALGGITYGSAENGHDPFAYPLETPADLRGGTMPGTSLPVQQGGGSAAPPPPPPTTVARAPAGTEVIGARARAALEAVDFPRFVAGLIAGTFQAIVDATVQQVREYARLVQSITQSAERFQQDNVSDNQVRDWLVEKYPRDLVLQVPRAGEHGTPRVVPRKSGSEPSWLDDFGLGGQELTADLTEGPLLQAARKAVTEERLQYLATMVLMGINRIVVSDGQIRAKLNFHATAREQVKADVMQGGAAVQGGLAGQNAPGGGVSTMVSTVSVNAQAATGIDTRLTGEVMIKFRSETFNLERFADSQAIQLINRHARTPESGSAAATAVPVVTPAPSITPAAGART